MVQHFGDLPGVETDIDDMLKAVLQRCKDINMTLNKEKCRFGLSKVVYLAI